MYTKVCRWSSENFEDLMFFCYHYQTFIMSHFASFILFAYLFIVMVHPESYSSSNLVLMLSSGGHSISLSPL